MTDTFIGRSLGKYKVESKLGHGGMGMVYRGRQASLNRAVAIKVLPAQMAMDTDFVQRFRQEAQVIAGLQHENIVHVYDIDQAELASGEPIYFIVMEYVDGHNLRQRSDLGRPLPWQRVREIGLPVAHALDYAHRRGIVHRDIKPANVMVTRDGKVKLMDFGIAKSAGGVKTATGSVLGTPEYMAPEQAQSGQVTPRSDIYSLGVLLYELATGRLPFEAAEPFAVALKHISEQPKPPRQVAPSVPPWLEQIILRALSKNPSDRQGDAATLARELEHAGGEAVSSASALGSAASAMAVSDMAVSDMDGAPTLETPSAVDPAAPTLQTPASGMPGATTPLPAQPPPSADVAPSQSPPPSETPTVGVRQDASGPLTASHGDSSRRPVAWWPVAAVLGVLALAAAVFLTMGRDDAQPVQPVASVEAGSADSNDLDAARRLLAAGDLVAARRHLDAYLAEHPDDAEAADVEGRLDHAERSLAQALAADDLLGEIGDAPSELTADSGDSADPTESVVPQPPVAQADPAADVEPTPPGPRPDRPRVREEAQVPAEPPRMPAARPAPPLVRAVPLRQLILQARRHREAKEFHSLRRLLRQISQHADRPGRRDAELEGWISKVDGWVADREDDLREEVEDMLDSFLDAVEDEDMDDVNDLWGGRPDAATQATFRGLWQTFRKVRAEYDLLSVEPWDHEAGFAATIRIYGKKERRDDMVLVRSLRWQGRIDDRDGTRMVAPFAP